MSRNIAATDLPHIVEIANRSGCMAVIQERKVAIFTPALTEVGEGFHHVGFRIQRVRTIAQAREVLRSARAGRRQLEKHGHHFAGPVVAATNEAA